MGDVTADLSLFMGAVIDERAFAKHAAALDRARHTPSIATTVAGLLVILGAFGAGSSFTKDGSNGASLAMALLAAVAMLCYAANLVILGKPGASSR